MSAMKIAARIQVTTGISLTFFPTSLQITNVITPYIIPFEIEYENGIAMIVMNAGIPSVGSAKSIFVTDFIIK